MPAGTSEPIVSRMRERLLGVTSSAAVQQRLAAGGITPLSGGAEDVRAFVRRTLEGWPPLIRQLGISLDA